MIENLDQNQIIFIILAMTISAVPVGFMAGLFGIGGGLITVPVLFYIFNFIGLEQAFIMHLAVGTSFSIIIPTSIISTMTHMKYKAVDLKIVKTFGLFVVFGVILGTIFAANLQTANLILFFSVMTMFFAIIFSNYSTAFMIWGIHSCDRSQLLSTTCYDLLFITCHLFG